ncbi:MAG TPA: hypothetical protein VLV16_03320 [Gemmatimonadales bacterium]|nr:hypothetical protein [Gemmatimonadales bacterium]
MKRSSNELIVHGVIGGLLAGLVVALWFLIVDTIAGYPFRTPASLAFSLYAQPLLQPTLRVVVMYSIVHLGVYALLGVAAAWAMVALQTAPRLLLGLFFGIVAQEVVFYTALFLSGLPPSEVVPWQHVIGANLLSGLALMTYLHRAERAQLPIGLGALKAHPQLTRGLTTGLLGGGVVALFFFFVDLITGHPFATPGALGSALLFGASNADAIDFTLGIVAAYTVVHFTAFAVAGIVFVAIAEQIERSPSFLLLAVMTVIVLEAGVAAVLAQGAQWVLGPLGVWAALVANVLAVGSMGWYVWQTHPVLRQRLGSGPVEVRV